MSPYKVREVLDLIRGKPVHEAEDILRFSERDAAFTVGKVLRSAVANAENNDDLDPEELFVSACFADEGATIKRWRPRARGRATRIRKRTSHITVIVSRLPDEDLRRLLARRRAEQLAQRARRVAGARRAEGDLRPRAERRHGGPVEPEDLQEAGEEVDAEATDVEAAEATEVEDAETSEADGAEASDVETAEAPESEGSEVDASVTETPEAESEAEPAVDEEEPAAAAETEASEEDSAEAAESAGAEAAPDEPDEKDE
jgi:large subunit ribosomal protein L22